MPGRARLVTERGLWDDAYRELLSPRTVAMALASVALFVVAMTIFGPLGTLEALAPPRRFAYWALCAGATFPLCYAWAAVVLYLTRRRSLVGILPAVVTGVLFEGLICTAVVVAVGMLFLPADAPPDLVSTYLTVTVVVGMCTLFAHYGVFLQLSQRRAAAAAGRSSPAAASPAAASPADGRDAAPVAAKGSGPAPPGATPPGATPPGATPPGTTEPRPRTAVPDGERADRTPLTVQQARFHDRLSRAVSRDVICLEMDDHYVKVHTTGGSCLILMRFADAVAELGVLGMQVHRSHWVAHRHMLATVRRDGRTVLRVTGGRNVPISRPYLPAVRAALRAQPSRPGAIHES